MSDVTDYQCVSATLNLFGSYPGKEGIKERMPLNKLRRGHVKQEGLATTAKSNELTSH